MRFYLTLVLLLNTLFSFGQEHFTISVNDTLKYQMHKLEDKKNTFLVDIGSFNSGQRGMHYSFKITNKSDTPLVVKNVSWGEPMFQPTFYTKPILKSHTGLIKYGCVTNTRTGVFMKSSLVSTNLEDFIIYFTGNGLPPEIFIDKPLKIDTVQLCDTIVSIFKIYNKSEADFYTQRDKTMLKIQHIKTDWKTSVSFVKEEVEKSENEIYTGDFKSFIVSYIPYKTGESKSKIILTINGINVEHIIYATVLPGK